MSTSTRYESSSTGDIEHNSKQITVSELVNTNANVKHVYIMYNSCTNQSVLYCTQYSAVDLNSFYNILKRSDHVHKVIFRASGKRKTKTPRYWKRELT